MDGWMDGLVYTIIVAGASLSFRSIVTTTKTTEPYTLSQSVCLSVRPSVGLSVWVHAIKCFQHKKEIKRGKSWVSNNFYLSIYLSLSLFWTFHNHHYYYTTITTTVLYNEISLELIPYTYIARKRICGTKKAASYPMLCYAIAVSLVFWKKEKNWLRWSGYERWFLLLLLFCSALFSRFLSIYFSLYIYTYTSI